MYVKFLLSFAYRFGKAVYFAILDNLI